MTTPAIALLNAFLLTLVALLLIPSAILFVECLAAILLPLRSHHRSNDLNLRTVILIPAHNEAETIKATLNSLIPQLTEQADLLVIADNCIDQTAAVARACGVQVIERFEPDRARRGKGYALDFGLRALAAEPPDVVVMVDADCIVAPGTIAHLTQQAYATQRPVQSTYLMAPPQNPRLKDSLSALAVVVKNHVRPLGLSHLGCPNLLTGSGMAFPWKVINQISLAGSKTCDDMQTSIDLAIAGYPSTYCPQTNVMGRLMQDKAATSQRSRWEHGHLEMLTTEVPRLLREALTQRRFDLVALALEVAVPPLSLLVMGWVGLLGIAIVNQLLGGNWLPIAILGVEGALLVGAIFGSWLKFERFNLSLTQLLGVPLYALSKIPLYVNFWVKPQTRWLRTERDEAQGASHYQGQSHYLEQSFLQTKH